MGGLRAVHRRTCPGPSEREPRSEGDPARLVPTRPRRAPASRSDRVGTGAVRSPPRRRRWRAHRGRAPTVLSGSRSTRVAVGPEDGLTLPEWNGAGTPSAGPVTVQPTKASVRDVTSSGRKRTRTCSRGHPDWRQEVGRAISRRLRRPADPALVRARRHHPLDARHRPAYRRLARRVYHRLRAGGDGRPLGRGRTADDTGHRPLRRARSGPRHRQPPTIAALVAYAQLPVIRDTYIGLTRADGAAIEAETGLGMTRLERVRRVRLPVALPVVMAGIRNAVVILVGLATIGAFIGAGGLGVRVIGGIQLFNTPVARRRHHRRAARRRARRHARARRTAARERRERRPDRGGGLTRALARSSELGRRLETAPAGGHAYRYGPSKRTRGRRTATNRRRVD